MEKHMKLSATLSPEAPMNDPFLFRGDLGAAIQKAAAIGYDGVELQISDPRDWDSRQVLADCKRCGVELSSMGTGSNRHKHGLLLTAPDRSVREKTVECVHRYIHVAAEAGGAKVIIGLIKGQAAAWPSFGEFEAVLADSLHQCLRKAESLGIELVVEAINLYESDNYNTVAEALGLLDRVSSPNLKLLLDTYHMNQSERSLVKAVLAAGERIGHLHYVDNNLCWPGNGLFDFSTMTSLLKGIGYRGYYAMECLPVPGEEAAARLALEYLRRLDELTEG